MATEIRKARPEDVPFLAEVVLSASRSHLPRGVWDLMLPEAEPRRAFLERLLATEHRHWCHQGGFLVAEVDGRPAAALSGYAAQDPELAEPAEAIELAWRGGDPGDPDEIATYFGRLAPFLTCLPEAAPDAWVVEWVATGPAYRRRGLVRALLEAELAEGRARGHRTGQITILIGNEPARRAYERAGFRSAAEKRSEAFEAALGSPGLLQLRRPL